MPIVDLLRILYSRKCKDKTWGGAVVIPPGMKRVVRWSTKGRSAAAAAAEDAAWMSGWRELCAQTGEERRAQEPRPVPVHAQYDCHPERVT